MQLAFAGYFRPMGRLGTRAGSFPDPVAARGRRAFGVWGPRGPRERFRTRGQGRSGPWGRASPLAGARSAVVAGAPAPPPDHASGRCTPSVARLPVDRAVEASRGTRYGVRTSPPQVPCFQIWRYHVRGGAGLTSVRTGDMSDRLARDPEADRPNQDYELQVPGYRPAPIPDPRAQSL